MRTLYKKQSLEPYLDTGYYLIVMFMLVFLSNEINAEPLIQTYNIIH